MLTVCFLVMRNIKNYIRIIMIYPLLRLIVWIMPSDIVLIYSFDSFLKGIEKYLDKLEKERQ